MANRTEVVQQVNAKIIPTVTTDILSGLLNDDLIENVLFRKDVIDTDSPSSGVAVIDYTDKDLSTITLVENTVFSFANLQDGDIKWLAVTKGAADTITFSGSVDISSRKVYINTTATLVVYRVIRKNLEVFCDAINIDNDRSVNQFTGGVTKEVITYPGWNMPLIDRITINLPDYITRENFVCAEIDIRGFSKSYPLLSAYIDIGFGTGPGGWYIVEKYGSGPDVGKSFIQIFRGTGATSVFEDPLFSNATATIILKYLST
jgi:hypothetical protein